MSRYQLETRLGLLHFSLSQCKDSLLALKLQRALESTQAALDRLPN